MTKKKTKPEKLPKKVYCVSRAAIEYSHAWIEADSPEEAIDQAMNDADWSFDCYATDGVLRDLTNGEIEEYEIQDEQELVCSTCGVEGGHRADCGHGFGTQAGAKPE